jgi:hypothetical protein
VYLRLLQHPDRRLVGRPPSVRGVPAPQAGSTTDGIYLANLLPCAGPVIARAIERVNEQRVATLGQRARRWAGTLQLQPGIAAARCANAAASCIVFAGALSEHTNTLNTPSLGRKIEGEACLRTL